MTAPTHAPGAQLLDPSVLAKISSLELRARAVVEGFIQGLHRAPHLGASTDFAEHRPYMPGDDTRRIDWKLYARSDRYYVKEFEADTNTNLVVFLDVSRSMLYGTKLQYACTLAACLAYFSSLQRDRVGLATFANSGLTIPPCGVPVSVDCSTPSSMYPDLSHARICFLAGNDSSLPNRAAWSMLSKQPLRSASTIQGFRFPLRERSKTILIASWALRPGLNP